MTTPLASPVPAEDAQAAGDAGVGGCLCGAIRFRFALPPLWVAHCHCSVCRRAQGAGFVTWIGIDGERFELLGDTGHLRSFRSSAEGTRSFCGRCGTPLFFESTRWPGELHITLGSVDAGVAARLAPQAHVHWADRASWIGEIHDGLPRHESTGSS